LPIIRLMAVCPNRSPRSLRLRDGRVIRFPAVMGVLNVTPDSFSDGGRFLDPARALDHALEMEAAGASIIDIGGESTRPVGAHKISAELELGRVGPVLERLAGRLRVPISIDTHKAVVARAALAAGAAIINDISALADPEMASLAAAAKCAVVLMHMRGAPDNHIGFARYRDVLREVIDYLARRACFAIRQGILRSRIIIDPGIGFAKTARHNLQILSGLERLCALGYPVLIGASRKTFVRTLAGGTENDALVGTAGAAIIRVHDVEPAAAMMRMGRAIAAARKHA
jgi:dihydropteroate synthase